MNNEKTCKGSVKSEKRDKILEMVSQESLLTKEYVLVKISGVPFYNNDDSSPSYIISELCFLKFSLSKGITKKLILFPDIIRIPVGYRELLYEDLEEKVGWTPRTFRSNHSVEECISEINCFFDGIYEPIFVPTKFHKKEVALALNILYNESKASSPWSTSYKIYRFEYLITVILSKTVTNSNKDVSVLVILDYWKKIKFEIAPETCERHLSYGLSQQCATNVLIKYLYSSFLMLKSPGMPNIRNLVSSAFYEEMDFIMPLRESKPGISHVNHDPFENCGIEDMIINLDGVTINSDAESVSKKIGCGRGRGWRGKNCNLWNS